MDVYVLATKQILCGSSGQPPLKCGSADQLENLGGYGQHACALLDQLIILKYLLRKAAAHLAAVPALSCKQL